LYFNLGPKTYCFDHF